jgi:hypothetical protein
MIMKIVMSYHNTGIRVLLFITVLFILNAAGAISARGIFIDSLEINKYVDKVTTVLHLRIPVNYLGHFPESEGRLLKIRFQPIFRQSFANIEDESLSPPPDDCPVIRDISLDHGAGNDYYLTYHFKHNVHYEVANQTNPQELIVTLRNPHNDEAGDPCNAR